MHTVSNAESTFSRYAAALRAEVDAHLDSFSQLGDGCPARLCEAIRYSLLAPGKRLRPMLVLMAAEACGSTSGKAMPAACAVEMIHAYSLVHDDLPAMDDDDLRRGRPTCHKAFDEATAILTGDALLTLAFEIIASAPWRPEVSVACCRELARAAGARQLVGGQADDLGAEFSHSGLEALESIHRRKTGAMINVSLHLGAIVAEADSMTTAALQTYGDRLGLAFQISDDLLDVRGSEADVGKRVAKDASHGKLTYPALLGIDESQRRLQVVADEACRAVRPLGERAANLEALARYVVERNH